VDIVHPRVAGLDVHKKVIWVAVRVPGQGLGERTVMVRRFASFCRSLWVMAWLAELGVSDAALVRCRRRLRPGPDHLLLRRQVRPQAQPFDPRHELSICGAHSLSVANC
jgi:hypothetical protein